MKKISLIIAACGLLILPFVFLYPKIKTLVKNKNEKNTFLKGISKNKLIDKIKNHSKWMEDRILEDLNPFYENKITQKALLETFNTIASRREKDKTNFIRFRIINNKLYMYIPEKDFFPKRQFTFEKALRTLCKMIKMPNVDIIYSDEDGTPLFFNQKDFFITTDPKLQAPLLSRGKHKNLKYIALIPDYHDLSYKNMEMINKITALNGKYPWEEKQNLAFWRGVNRKKARYLLSIISYQNPSLIDAGFPDNIHEENQDIDTPNADISHLKKEFASHDDHLKYKYLPVLDGFFCTYPGYQWRLFSNSLCFKQESLEIQWFYKGLKPYEHYIPIKDDMSDILEKIDWARKNDGLCKKITENAMKFASNNLFIENTYAYLFLLLTEYEKQQAFNKKDLIKDTSTNKKWICIQDRKAANNFLKKRGFKVF
ncbi:MAG: KDEL (Lys-Asp-Glu-Leu) containing 1 [uncultured bacterium]|nr:MAG: KDEL (Lys-Asp-Glu-Leu) containing 1 [uncultured bacterium]